MVELVHLSINNMNLTDELLTHLYLREMDVDSNVIYTDSNSKLLIILEKDEYDTLVAIFSKYYGRNIQKTFIEKKLKSIVNYKKIENNEPLVREVISNYYFSNSMRSYRTRERRVAFEFLFKVVSGDNTYIPYFTSNKIIIWSKKKVDIRKAEDILTKTTGYVCPICGYQTDTIEEMSLHFLDSHSLYSCPLDGKPIDEHMLSDPEHLAWSYLTLFTYNQHLDNSREYLLANVFARMLFSTLSAFSFNKNKLQRYTNG